MLTPAPAGSAAEAWACQLLEAHSRGLAWLLRLACPPEGQRAFTLIYAAFRVADDLVDAPGADPARVATYLAHHAALRAGRRPPGSLDEHALCKGLEALDGRLAPVAEGMAAALEWDASRRGQRVGGAALEAQLQRIGDSYLDALWICSDARGPVHPALYELSRAATGAHQLRDLREDLALGYVNLPLELLPGEPQPDPARVDRWIPDRCAELHARFDYGLQALHHAPPRTRLLLRALALKYRRLLDPQRLALPATS